MHQTPPIEAHPSHAAAPLLPARADTVALPLDTLSVDIHDVDIVVSLSIGDERNPAAGRRPRRVIVHTGIVSELCDIGSVRVHHVGIIGDYSHSSTQQDSIR